MVTEGSDGAGASVVTAGSDGAGASVVTEGPDGAGAPRKQAEAGGVRGARSRERDPAGWCS